MSVISRIKNAENDFTDAERNIAEYILDNPNKVLQMTTEQLGRISETSAATVVRFCKKIQINSFTQLKIKLSAAMQLDDERNNDLFPIESTDDLPTLKSKISANAIQTIQETTDQIDDQTILEVAQLMHDCDYIFTFGVGASYLTAQDVAQKWSRAGKVAIASNQIDTFLQQPTFFSSRSLFFIISNSGENPEASYVVNELQGSRPVIVSMTRLDSNSISKGADYSLYTSIPDEKESRLAATNSILAQSIMIDVLFYQYVNMNYGNTVDSLTIGENRIKDLRNWSRKNNR